MEFPAASSLNLYRKQVHRVMQDAVVPYRFLRDSCGLCVQSGNISQIMNTHKFDALLWNDNNVIKIVDPLPAYDAGAYCVCHLWRCCVAFTRCHQRTTAVSHLVTRALYDELVAAIVAVQTEKKARVWPAWLLLVCRDVLLLLLRAGCHDLGALYMSGPCSASVARCTGLPVVTR